MNILGIDAALGGFSAALFSIQGEIHTMELPGNVALESGLSAVADLMERASGTFELQRIGVGIGPGYFTGARIAISYAKSLALGWQLPLCGISSFDAIEAGVDIGNRPVLCAVHGRSGVVSTRWRHGTKIRRASGYTADVLAALNDVLIEPFALIGNGAEDVLAALGERASNVQILTPAVEPAALAIAMLSAQTEPASSLHEVRADYGDLPPATVPKI